ncbi:hypothetical protein FQA47_008124 [Oryzias melastigma]|uniref:Uncharacterized protein n=1 Tax=Oryzias melastigma TaxID=30732 RepID=A0A834CJH7_ORYME|nr:hypothetical protein FQA47_008124 [Oryzias melastigma]
MIPSILACIFVVNKKEELISAPHSSIGLNVKTQGFFRLHLIEFGLWTLDGKLSNVHIKLAKSPCAEEASSYACGGSMRYHYHLGVVIEPPRCTYEEDTSAEWRCQRTRPLSGDVRGHVRRVEMSEDTSAEWRCH